MRVLYVCDRLITFILNEIIELKKNNNDLYILSEYSKRTFDVISRPILIENDLEHKHFRFHMFKSRKQKYIYFLQKLICDFFSHPAYTLKSIKCILNDYPSVKYGVAAYIDARELFGFKFDVIHSPFSTPRSLDKVYLLSKVLSVPYTLCFRAHDLYEKNNFSEIQERIHMLRESSQIMTIAEYNRENMKTFNGIGDIEIVHSAINPEHFRRTDAVKTPNSIISVCRLDDEKGVSFLVEACHILNQRNIEYRCTIIGEGPEKVKYEKMIDEMKIPEISFIDYLPYNEVKVILNRSVVFVLPCVIGVRGQRDILANVLKEAMAMEVPVITSSVCGIEELVDDGVNGLLTPPHDSAAIADAIEKIFNHKEFADNLGKEGRKKIVNNFSVKTEALKLENILMKVAN